MINERFEKIHLLSQPTELEISPSPIRRCVFWGAVAFSGLGLLIGSYGMFALGVGVLTLLYFTYQEPPQAITPWTPPMKPAPMPPCVCQKTPRGLLVAPPVMLRIPEQ